MIRVAVQHAADCGAKHEVQLSGAVIRKLVRASLAEFARRGRGDRASGGGKPKAGRSTVNGAALIGPPTCWRFRRTALWASSATSSSACPWCARKRCSEVAGLPRTWPILSCMAACTWRVTITRNRNRPRRWNRWNRGSWSRPAGPTPGPGSACERGWQPAGSSGSAAAAHARRLSRTACRAAQGKGDQRRRKSDDRRGSGGFPARGARSYGAALQHGGSAPGRQPREDAFHHHRFRTLAFSGNRRKPRRGHGNSAGQGSAQGP